MLTGFAAGTLILGLSGNDHLTGQDADDRLEGGEGNDTLIGNGGPDELIGGNGDDTLFDAAGDTLDGGNDDDLIVIDAIRRRSPAARRGHAAADDRHGGPAGRRHRAYRDRRGCHGGFFRLDRGCARVDHGERRHDRDRRRAWRYRRERGRQLTGSSTAAPAPTHSCSPGRAQYRVEQLGHGDIRLLDLRVGLPDGMDSVRQVERFVFADGTFDATTVLNDPPTGGVTILGSATEDQTLTVDAAALADEDGLGALHYQWQRDAGGGFVNVGADQSSYTPGDADVGAMIRVIVSYTDLNGAPEQVVAAHRSRRQRQRRAGDRRRRCRDHDPWRTLSSPA